MSDERPFSLGRLVTRVPRHRGTPPPKQIYDETLISLKATNYKPFNLILMSTIVQKL